MAETLTTNIGLRKHDKGDPDWHTPVNANMDDVDKYLGLRGGDPNVEGVVAKFIGQRFFQPNAVAWWVAQAVGALGWAREIPRGLISMFSGTVAPPGWHLCDGSTVTIDTVDLVLPNLSGLFVVGYTPGDPDYDTIGEMGGTKNFVVGKNNIQQFNVDPAVGYRWGGATVEVLGQSPGVNADSGSNQTTPTVGVAVPAPIDNRPPYYVLAYIAKL